MGKLKFDKFFVGDFETTVYEGQDHTEVWASAVVEMYTEDVKIHHSITDTLDFLNDLDCNVAVYYHNLKFDGMFWIWYLLNAGFRQASVHTGDKNAYPGRDLEFVMSSKMKKRSFKYSVSNLGQWYSITIKVDRHIIQLRDSLKLLPFSVKKIGKDFKTKHQKLEMEYEGFRYSGCWITPEEWQYIANDVLVVKEALEIMFDEGHNKLTIATCALSEFKSNFPEGPQVYDAMFPNLQELELPEEYGAKNVDEYIRKAYKGGWCYYVKGKERRIYHNGTTADVNSLYPSMMHSMSGNHYPVGKPKFSNDKAFIEKMINRWCIDNAYYFFVRLRCRFYLKKGMLPTIQIKNSVLYDPREWLITSDVYNEATDHYSKYTSLLGGVFVNTVELTLTKTDFILFLEHYDIRDLEFLDIAVFDTEIGLFDKYIDKYAEIKRKSKGAQRALSKLMLNSLYGKYATSDDSSFKYAYMRDDDSVGFFDVEAHDKQVVYIPIGAAITSYARNFTIRAAQQNFYGINKPGFIYADTDSIHCDLPPEKIKGIEVDDTDFCCWKLEACWDEAYFVRQKTYVEHVTHEDLKPVEKPYYNIKAAGMPDGCKELFKMSMEGKTADEWREELGNDNNGSYKWDKMHEKEREFVLEKTRKIDDFDLGLSVPGKLMPKSIKGGVLLVKTTYEMR